MPNGALLVIFQWMERFSKNNKRKRTDSHSNPILRIVGLRCYSEISVKSHGIFPVGMHWVIIRFISPWFPFSEGMWQLFPLIILRADAQSFLISCFFAAPFLFGTNANNLFSSQTISTFSRRSRFWIISDGKSFHSCSRAFMPFLVHPSSSSKNY